MHQLNDHLRRKAEGGRELDFALEPIQQAVTLFIFASSIHFFIIGKIHHDVPFQVGGGEIMPGRDQK